MSLADVPIATRCIVTSAGSDPADSPYRSAGVGRGVVARVLARYPASRPTFAEVELEGLRLITVPLAAAGDMQVEIIDGEVER